MYRGPFANIDLPGAVRLTTVGLLALLAITLAAGCRNDGQLKLELGDFLSAAHEHWKFSGTVLIAHNGKPLFSRTYGLADRAKNVKLKPDTRFYIGSLTKQFTAAAVLALVNTGQIDLDSPITAYLTDYRTSLIDPADTVNYGHHITVRHLLQHTAGLPEYAEILRFNIARRQSFTSEQLYQQIVGLPLRSVPGQQFLYSNTNYILLGRIVERLSGQTYAAFLDSAFFTPLGMTGTGHGAAEENIAIGYSLDAGRQLQAAVKVHPSFLFAAGGLYSTAGDLLRWETALRQASILSDSLIELMTTPGKNGYGFGLYAASLFEHRHIYHGGFVDGFNSTLSSFPDDSLTIIVLSNEERSPVPKLAMSLAAILINQKPPDPITKPSKPTSRRALVEYAGVYAIDSTRHAIVSLEGDSLFFRFIGERPQLLSRYWSEEFFLELDNTTRVIFHRDPQGSIDGLTIEDWPFSHTGERLASRAAASIPTGSVTFTADQLTRYTGSYLLEYTPGYWGDLELYYEDAHLHSFAAGSAPIALVPLSETLFVHGINGDTVSHEIVFNIDTSGRITGCTARLGGVAVSGPKIR